MRNHVAKVLWTPKFRSKTVKSKKSYSRKIKHKKLENDELFSY